eukprot:c19775_g1_i1 orf=57-1118(+)
MGSDSVSTSFLYTPSDFQSVKVEPILLCGFPDPGSSLFLEENTHLASSTCPWDMNYFQQEYCDSSMTNCTYLQQVQQGYVETIDSCPTLAATEEFKYTVNEIPACIRESILPQSEFVISSNVDTNHPAETSYGENETLTSCIREFVSWQDEVLNTDFMDKTRPTTPPSSSFSDKADQDSQTQAKHTSIGESFLAEDVKEVKTEDCCNTLKQKEDERLQIVKQEQKGHPSVSEAKKRNKTSQNERLPKLAIMTRSEIDIIDDGYRWRKYGQKAVKNTPYQRSYYRCTNKQCSVKKHVERYALDSAYVMTTYRGIHSHPSQAAMQVVHRPICLLQAFPFSLEMQAAQATSDRSRN